MTKRGIPLSEEHKEKLRQVHKGKVLSEETKARMSASRNTSGFRGVWAQIASVITIGKVVYVQDHHGGILFLITCDGLLGYTPTSVTVRLKSDAVTYDNLGRQQNIQTLR